jgi:hypothetical protein
MIDKSKEEKEFEKMLKFALMNKGQRKKAEIDHWEDKAKGKHRQHHF